MRTKKWLGMLSSVGLPLLFGVILFVLWQTQVLHGQFCPLGAYR